MAQDSKQKRKNRRKKIAARIAAQTNRQQLRDLSGRQLQTQFTLLAVLHAHKFFVIPKEDAQAVLTGFTQLGWKSERQDDGSVRVELVDNRPAVVSEPPSASEMNIPLAPREPVEPARTDVTA